MIGDWWLTASGHQLKANGYQPAAKSGVFMGLEVEVKFLVGDLGVLRERVVAAGGVVGKPRVFERNVTYDNAWNGLRRKGQLLRLRQDAGVRLTFKGQPPVEMADSEAKVREEIEVSLDDFDQMVAILGRMGFETRQVYEKYRETFMLAGVEIVLDELPFGDFAELEGDEADIRRLSAVLGLDWAERVIANYLGLMAQVQAHYGLPFDDLTFANFRGVEVVMGDVLGNGAGA